jgi:pimeloyl-ACP methyl ester carboxylesterase
MNLVFLPATDSLNETYGQPPSEVDGFPEASTFVVKYPQEVWYNANIRSQAIAEIQALDIGPIVLFGFSKSGPGAWNIARAIPELVSATVIFDAPMTRRECPTWGAELFYKDDEAWQQDLPINSINDFQNSMPDTHRLIMISGHGGWHPEMVQMSEALSKAGCRHSFIARPDMKHHWNSGWIELGLRELSGPANR